MPLGLWPVGYNAKPPGPLPANQGSTLRQGLLGFWVMGEGAGTTAYDLLGVKNGALTSGVTWKAGRWGPTLSFPGGTANGVALGSMLGGVALKGVTAAIWFRNTTTAEQQMLTHDAGGTNARVWQLRINSTANVEFIPFSTSTNSDIVSTSTYNDGKWHHAVATYDLANVRLYVDGVAAKAAVAFSGTGMGTGTLTTGQAYIGWSGVGISPANSFNGLLDLAGIWNRALLPSEVRDLYLNPFILLGTVLRPLSPASGQRALLPDPSWSIVRA